jgi:ATP-dependent Lon protease
MAVPDTFESIGQEKIEHIPSTLPVVPLRGTLAFPRIPMPMMAGREGSRRALAEVAESAEKLVLLVAQKEREKDKIGAGDLYDVGTVAKVLQLYAAPNGVLNFVIQGYARARVRWYNQFEPSITATIEVISEPVERTPRIEALQREVQGLIRRYIELEGAIPEEAAQWVSKIDDPNLLADLVAAFVPELSVEQKQQVLEAVELEPRLRHVITLLNEQIEILGIKAKIHGEIKQGMEKTQREYLLREQMKAIQKELNGDAEGSETDQLRKQIADANMPEEVQKKAEKEVARLEAMPQGSPETGMIRSYIDTLLALPWSKETEDRLDIAEASQVLDDEHYGLGKVKDRILEHLAVRKLAPELRTPILCFVGPPGVGKTSLAKSIARALGRQSVRISLGGVHDEAEIRGHRRTYIGSMPGRIIQGMKNAGTRNPVFILDEIDKVGADFRGDPAAALLEVLDPEQNKDFADHYLDVPFDLSKVLFITTANLLDTVPAALRDRMEIIPLAGYTEVEKVQIAIRHLVPRQLKEHGLTVEQLSFSKEGLEAIIRGYTREAGVRSLERQIATVARKVARRVAEGDANSTTVSPENVADYLGPRKFTDSLKEEADEVGLVTGLAWTETGGDVLTVEATVMEGGEDGQLGLTLTGQLGNVMQESARTALSYVRSHARALHINPALFTGHSVHVHVPAGAIPKDGPSAGVTMATALASALSGRPVNRDVAMTGEVTLRGRVLPIGGLKEKVMAAHRFGVSMVLFPKENERDLEEIPSDIRADLQLIPVERVEEVLFRALHPETVEVPVPLSRAS